MKKATMVVVAKRMLRGIVSIIAVGAGLVFLFDNRLSDTGLTVLLGSIAVIFVCGSVWLLFDLGEWSEQKRDASVNNHADDGDPPNVTI